MHDVNKFINDLLDQEIGVKDDVRKLLVLINNEKKKGIQINSEVLDRIKKLIKADDIAILNTKHPKVTKIHSESTSKEMNVVSSGKEDLPKYITPKNIAQFLTELNRNKILRSTTHTIDEDILKELLVDIGIDEYDYSTHMIFVRDEFEKLRKQFNLPAAILAKLNEFYFFEKKLGWSEKNVKVSWCSTEIKEWCKMNVGRVPNPGHDLDYLPAYLNEVINVDGKILNTFEDGINLLKTQIECRDESYLENVLDKINQEKFSALNINIDKVSKTVRFYTDVEKVKQGYTSIINLCKEVRNQSKKSLKNLEIEVRLNTQRINTDNVVILSILDKGGMYNRDIDIHTFRYGISYTKIIKNYLNGLCHIELRADLPNKSSVFYSIWPKGDKVIPLKEPVNGVQYDLIFFVN